MMRHRVYLFDIDGTLLASGGAGKAAMAAALKHLFGADDRVDGVPFAGRTDRLIARDLFAAHGREDTADHWNSFQAAYLERLPGMLATCTGSILPGIAELLQRLDGRAHIGLLTGNIRRGAVLKLGHYGIAERFAFGGFGDRHFDRNEVAHEALAAARAHVGNHLAPHDVWVIGDTPLDVRCARAIGARVAAVATGQHSTAELAAAEPDLVFATLADLSADSPLLQ